MPSGTTSRRCAPSCRQMSRSWPVVKANGFGHGYVEPSRAFLDAGADALAVTRLDEAAAIREAGITAPVLIFAPIQPENVEASILLDIETTVSDISLARAISDRAANLRRLARIHIKVDTGMSRLGAAPEAAVELAREVSELPGVRLAGVYTHLATAAERNLAFAREQLRRFREVVSRLDSELIDYGVAHAANSAAILRLPESHYGMVRPGTILYGQYPSAHVPRRLDLKPAWKLKASVREVKHLPAGAYVGYGAEFRTKRRTTTAVLPVGYADGFTVSPEGPIYKQNPLEFMAHKLKRAVTVEIRGRKAPVIGRVAMQMCVVDVTDIRGVCVGDEATIPTLRVPTSALIPRV